MRKLGYLLSQRRRPVVIAAAAILVAGLLVAIVPESIGHRGGERGESADRDRLEDQERAEPGEEGEEGEEGPGSVDAEWFYIRAYPDSDIALSRFTGARNAAAATKRKGFPSGKGRPGSWVSIGPSQAQYQFTERRTFRSYVPNAYLASGRVTAMALDPGCRPGECRLWIAAAGGGVWRTRNALADTPSWTYLSGAFATNAIGSITLDPNDPGHNTLWVGTGEENSCSAGCVAGVGLYRSTDGGDTWTGPYGGSVFAGRGVGSVTVVPGRPGTLYAATGFAVNGHSSVCCSGATRVVVPGAAPWGVYRSTDGGASWTYVHNGSTSVADCGSDPTAVAANLTPCSPRGVRQVVLDPVTPTTVYASSYARGVWRSADAGTTWLQIKPSLNPAQVTTLPWMAVTTKDDRTRMYVSEGHVSDAGQYSRLFRSDDVTADSPAFTDLTSNDPANPGYGSFDFCTGQCWYDNAVYTPAGHPDLVYLLGSYQYGETGGISNGRGVLLSTDAGASFTDQTMDATDPVHPTGIHPDEHVIVTNPANPYQFIEGSDGGVIRSSGVFADISANCNTRSLAGSRLDRCRQLLSRVPTALASLNQGLPTLQFQSLSVSPFDANIVQGGTQDNGTFQTTGSPVLWPQTFWGDGGQSGFDAAMPDFRFHTFFDASPEVNFSGGAIEDWNVISQGINGRGALFYAPIITDPTVSRTMYVGTTTTALRTKTHGMGTMSLAEFRSHCNRFTGDFAVRCGDWQQLGTASLTSATLGSRAGGAIAAVERSAVDSSTLWVATATGRLFLSHNSDAEPASAVTFTRLDTLSPAAPGRFISGIQPDPANPNRAWVSYSGFSAATPTTAGHVFEVVYDPAAGTATWTDRSLDLGDLPITDIVYDRVTGDLYASSDFGVSRLAAGATGWTLAAPGMPDVEVAGLTIATGARKLFAASHGLGAWSLNLS